MTNLILKIDKKASISQIKNYKSQYHIKNIDVEYYYIKNLINNKKLIIK